MKMNIRSKIICCKDCKFRHENCHSECTVYKEQKDAWAAEKAALAAENRADFTRWKTFHEFKNERIKKRKR